MKRRSFLKVAGTVAGGCALGVKPVLAEESSGSTARQQTTAGLPRRMLG